MIDIGLNLASRQFDKDRDIIVKDALDSGVTGFILTGTTLESSRKVLGYSKENSLMVSTSGVHPNYSYEWSDNVKEQISVLAKEKEVVAVGECGLDYCGDHRPSREIQKKAFEDQLKLASDINKPVFLHVRPDPKNQDEILNDFMEIYKKYNVPGVVHCFTGNEKLLKSFLDLDLYIGITGWITDERRGKSLQTLVKQVPLNKIMIETDAPYLTPFNVPKNKFTRRNTPKLLPYVLDAVSHYMGLTPDELNLITDTNVFNLFFN